MTKTEAAELQELGSTPEQMAERQAKVAQLLNGPGQPGKMVLRPGFPPALIPSELDAALNALTRKMEPEPARKRRSDADKPRPKKAEPSPAGVLTQEQVNRIYELIAEHGAAKEEAEIANTNALHAANRLELYLDSLKARQ